ncbi:hypothetical protein R1flu_022532 [Riccia fluitans]|uniref:Mitotic checkpoint serine/threonine-protein kinase BUB1 n=1 Tax=Riccia fluitans TaxID=41844 RepID=A0ABD1XQ11_9MARC
MEWELSKENVQPMKSGHCVAILNESLKAKTEGRSRSSVLETQRREFLEAIEQYNGEDPLEPWMRCIKWTRDAYPSIGPQSELVRILEGCTRQFLKDERYRDDPRYLRVWVQYADTCTDPTDVFAFLEANNIGQTHALFYIAYATTMEARKNYIKSEEIYRIGIARRAEPLGRIQTMCKSFLVRMHRRNERRIREEQELLLNGPTASTEPQSRSFGPNSAYPETQFGGNRERQAPAPPPFSRSNRSMNTKMSVFVDPEFQDSMDTHNHNVEEPGPSSRQTTPWYSLPSEGDRKKENSQQPTKWTEAKVKQSVPFSDGRHSKLDVYVDEEFSKREDQPKPTKPAPPPVMKLRLEDMQSMMRTSPRLKGSFLERSSAALDSSNKTSGIPGSKIGTAATHEARIPVTAYDAGMLVGDDGAEKCFEEVRLDVWKETYQVLLDPVAADTTEKRKGEGFLESRTELRGTEETVLLEGRNVPGTSPSTSDSQTARLVETHNDDILARSDENEMVRINSSDGLFDASTNVPALTGADSIKISESDCRKELREGNSPFVSRSSDSPFRIPDSLCTQGDETIAIKRVADEIIVLGTDPLANCIDAGSHQGLVEPTINTKECVADILDWFNKPLESDNSRRNTRVPRDSKKNSNSLGGFQIYEDEDLQAQRSEDYSKDRKRLNSSSSTFGGAGQSQVGGFEVYVDENLGSERTARGSSRLADKNSSAGSFKVFQDESFGMQPPKSKQSQRKRSSSQSKGYQIFVDDEFCDTVTPHIEKDVGMSAPSPKRSVDYLLGKSPVKVYEDEAMDLNSPNPRKIRERVKSSSNRPTTSLGVYIDEDLRNLSLTEPLSSLQDVKESSQQGLFSLHDKENFAIPQGENNVDVPEATGEVKCPKDNSSGRNMEADIDPPERPVPVNQTCSAYLTDNGLINRVTLEMAEERPDTVPVSVKIDPWDETTLKNLLSKLQTSLSTYEGYFENNKSYRGPLPMSCVRASNGGRNKIIELDNCTYRIKRCVGEGAFAHVFEAEDEEDDYFDDSPKIALKFQRQACTWEFYMYRQLDMRIPGDERRYYGNARRMHLYTDCSFMICDYGEKGTLQDVVNAYLAKSQKMEEGLCMFYTIEMLHMLEVLHAAGIIHGDIKPDNLLIRDHDDSPDLEDWSPEYPGSWKSQGLCLIDWGRSIDLTLFPEGTMFHGDCKTDSFRCPEMLENLPWKFQVDTFGLCGVVHCLLFGSYMQIEKVKNGEGRTLYRPRTTFKRWWNVNLWRELFDTLLNVEEFGDRILLSQLRQKFERHLVDSGLGKKLKGYLSGQNILMFTANRR